MAQVKRKGDLLSDETKRRVIKNTIKFFNENRQEDIGIIAAEEILDFFLKETSETIYNKGVEDSTKIVNESFKDLEVNLDVLKFISSRK